MAEKKIQRIAKGVGVSVAVGWITRGGLVA
jgi:hypothetical protein